MSNKKQMMMFSATINKNVMDLVKKYFIFEIKIIFCKFLYSFTTTKTTKKKDIWIIQNLLILPKVKNINYHPI
jgi:hypothetical protein